MGRREAEPPPAWGTSWRESLKLVAVTRAAFLVCAYLAAWFLASSHGAPKESFESMWSHWDARHFFEVATYGYTDPRTDPHATAFFPLFPLTIKALGALIGGRFAAAMVINFASTVVAGAFLYRIADEERPGAGRAALLYLLLFPTAVFLIAPYSEPLFLAGAIPAFYYARRGRWGAAALPAAVAVGTRAAGVFILVGLLVEFLRRRDFKAATVRAGAVALTVAVLPLIAYAIYLAQAKGNAFYFFTDQRLGWGRDFTAPWTALATTWRLANDASPLTNFIIAWRVELVAAAIGIAGTIYAVVRRELGYAAYMGTTMFALMSSSAYLSVPRMLLSLFPLLIFGAVWTARQPRRHEIALIVMGPLATLGVVVFTQGGWFF